jgi:hypothetical protein
VQLCEVARAPDIGFQHASHVVQGCVIILASRRSGAIRRNEKGKFPHVRVARRVEDTTIASHTTENQPLHAQLSQPQLQRSGIEP